MAREKIKTDAEVEIFRSTMLRRAYAPVPPNGDYYYQALNRVAYQETGYDGALRRNLEEAFASRVESARQITPQVMASVFERAVHAEALNMLEPDVYPLRFGPPSSVSQENWRKVLEAIARRNDIDSSGYDTFQQRLEMNLVNSNIPERAIGPKILLALFPERFGDTPQILEAGCSLNFLLKWLAHSKLSRSGRVEIVGPDGLTADRELTRLVNGVLAARLVLGESLGVDIEDPYRDPAFEEWGIVCSVTPGEMAADPARIGKIKRLAKYDPKNVHFYQADFTDELDMLDFPPDITYRRRNKAEASRSRPLAADEFDTAISSTVEYMLDNQGRHEFEQREARHTKDDAIRIKQDFAWPERGRPEHVEFAADIYSRRYLYATMFYDEQLPELGWQVAFRWETGRPKRALLNSAARIAVGESVVTLGERLKDWST